MSAIPVEQIEPNRDETGGPQYIPVRSTNGLCAGHGSPLLHVRRLHMRVKLCALCPYTQRDLADHYDLEAILHLCANCDGEQRVSTNEYPRKTDRRQKCATIPNFPAPAQSSVARSAMASSASSGAIPGGPRSVPGNALTTLGPVKNVTAGGYAGSNRLEHHATRSRSSEPPPN
jgi:hypothetical protein